MCFIIHKYIIAAKAKAKTKQPIAINAAGKPSNPPFMGPLIGKVPIPEKNIRVWILFFWFHVKNAINLT